VSSVTADNKKNTRMFKGKSA